MVKKSLRGLAIASVATLALGTLATTAQAQAPSNGGLGNASDYYKLPAGSAGKIEHNRYMVQVAGNPTAKGGNEKANKAAQDKVVQAAKAAGITINVKNNHTYLWNGFSAEVSDSQADMLRSLPGVVSVHPVVTFDAPEPIRKTGATPAMANAIEMTGAKLAQQEGYTGKGIKVGVIDSGIDLDHADLGGDGVAGNPQFPNARVKYGYDFVGDNYDASGRYGSTTPTPDAIPDDCGGHGSHVAGIIGASGTAANSVTGIAPDVTFGAYRVFGCEGSVDTDVIVAAIEKATADGMDIINMSLGWGFYTWPDAPEALAADRAVDAGVIVVDAMGNDGEYGTFTGGAPAVGEKQIAVASVENTVVTSRAFKLGERLIGYSAGDSAPVPTTGSLQVVSAGPDAPVVDGTEPVSGCDPSMPLEVDATGKALLMKRGFCTFYEKAMNAQQAGATMAIIYNRENALMTPALTGPEGPITIPVVIITLADGLALQSEIAAKGSATLTLGDYTAENPNPKAGLASTFTSVGMAATLDLKPDVAAPGGNIWSTYPLEKGGYTNMSGTSMATPHVAGSIALLLEARPEYKGKALAVRELLQNYASPLLWHLAPKYGLLDMVQVQGAGLINIHDAIHSDAHLTPGKLVLGEGYEAETHQVTLVNTSKVAKTYTTSFEDAVGAAAPTDDPSYDIFESTVTMPATVTVPAGGQVTVPVTIAPNKAAPNGFLYGGYVRFTNGDEVLSLPYGGMAGDYQAEQVLTMATLGKAGLNPQDPNEITPIPPAEGTLPVVSAKSDAISVIFHLQYPASNVVFDLYEATKDGTKGAYVGKIYETGKMGRDDSSLTFTWDGSYLKKPGKNQEYKKAGPGNYIIEMRVLKPLGDPNDPNMWEVWTSPAFRLKSMN